MSAQRPPGEQSAGGDGPAATTAGPPSPAVVRANRMSAANMLRSLGPLVVLVLVVVGYVSLRQPDDAVHPVDPSMAVGLARARAGYPVPAPAGLPDGYRATYARTDAGSAATPGDPVTLEIGYVAPAGGFAGFVVSDDERAAPLRAVLDGAQPEGPADLGGQQWQRLRTARGETAFSRRLPGEATATVTGSATDAELSAVAASVRAPG